MPPGALVLVRAAGVTFSNGSLGCPQPGFAYTEALVAGFELLYEHEGIRYEYHVSESGAQLTDCRGEGAEALPFRTGRGIVSVTDAFALAERQGPLAAEVVLRTAEEAAAYVAAHSGAVSIDDAAVDWSTQLLAGAVVTGTGCTFASAIAAALAKGSEPRGAVAMAKAYITKALQSAYPLGRGQGPVHHFFRYWQPRVYDEMALPASRRGS